MGTSERRSPWKKKIIQRKVKNMCDCKDCEKFDKCAIGKKEKKCPFWLILIGLCAPLLLVVAPAYVLLFLNCQKEEILLELVIGVSMIIIVALIGLTIVLCKMMQKCQDKKIDSSQVLLDAFNKIAK